MRVNVRFVWGACVRGYLNKYLLFCVSKGACLVVCLSSLCVGSGSRVCPVRGSEICRSEVTPCTQDPTMPAPHCI